MKDDWEKYHKKNFTEEEFIEDYDEETFRQKIRRKSKLVNKQWDFEMENVKNG